MDRKKVRGIMHPLIEAIEEEIETVRQRLEESQDYFMQVQASYQFGNLNALKEDLDLVMAALDENGINNRLTDAIITRSNGRKSALVDACYNGYLSDYCRGEIEGHSVVLELIQNACTERDYVEG